MAFKLIGSFSILLLAVNAHATDTTSIHTDLADAIICKAKPSAAVYDLVNKGSNFNLGYAAYGFGDGTGHKAVVILDNPLTLFGSTATAVISETEHSYFDFSAFTYAKFKGDYKQAVKALNLQLTSPPTKDGLGKFVSIQPSSSNECPETIALTPTENGYFLLGCGWCNGG